MLITLLLLGFLALTPTQEEIELNKIIKSEGNPAEKACILLEYKPYITSQSIEKTVKYFIKKNRKYSKFLARKLINVASPLVVLKTTNLQPIKYLTIETTSSKYKLPPSINGEIDPGSLFKSNEFPLLLGFNVKALRETKLKLYIETPGALNISINGNSTKMDIIGEVVKIEIPLKKGDHSIVLTLKEIPKGKIWITTENNKRIKFISTFPKKSSIKKKTTPIKIIRAKKIFTFTAQLQCEIARGKVPYHLTFPLKDKYSDPMLKAKFQLLTGKNPKAALPKGKDKNQIYLNSLIMGDWVLRFSKSRKAFSIFSKGLKKTPNGLRGLSKLYEIYSGFGLHSTALFLVKRDLKKYGATPELLRLATLFSRQIKGNPLNYLQQLSKTEGSVESKIMLAVELINRGRAPKGFELLKSTFIKEGNLQSLSILGSYASKNSEAKRVFKTISSSLKSKASSWYRTSFSQLNCKNNNCTPFGELTGSYLKDREKIIKSSRSIISNKNEIIMDRQILKVEKNGLTKHYRHIYYRVGNSKIVNKNRSFSTRFSQSNQKFTLITSSIHHKSGKTTKDVALVDYYRLQNSKTRIYFDLTEIKLKLPKLLDGDTVEIAWQIEGIPTATTTSGTFFGLILPFQEFIFSRKTHVEIYYPKSLNLNIFMAKHKNIKLNKIQNKITTHLSFHGKNIPGINIEPGMPGWGETVLSIQVGLQKSWKDIGKDYWSFIKGSYRLTPKLKRIAQNKTRNIPSRSGKIAALHRYVLKNYRYVSLMFGLHSYLPYKPEEILERGFGDCKDITLLLVLMLDSVGIKAYPAAVRTRILGNFDFKIPSLTPFDHSIVYLPKENKWLDTTSKHLIYPLLPAHIQGRTALVLFPSGGELKTTSISTHNDNIETSNMVIKLNRKGSASILENIIIKGEGESGWRTFLRLKRKSLKWHMYYSVIKKIKHKLFNFNNLKSPFKIESKVKIEGFFKKTREKLVGNLAFYEGKITRRLIPSLNRTQDLLFEFPGQYNRNITLKIPHGYCFDKIPKNFKIKTLPISFKQKIVVKKRELIVERSLKLKVWRIKPNQYNQFKKTVKTIRSTLSQKTQLKKCSR
jgi:Domain of Unknown Function with PDB structure (DUF3857)/Transglutaminase-like superfamily